MGIQFQDMATEEQTLKVILHNSVQQWKENKYKTITIVLGNMSCDLDSAVCSVVYAAYLKWRHTLIENSVCTRCHRGENYVPSDVFIPVLNVPKDDYTLKTEVCYELEKYNLDTGCFVFRNEIDSEKLKSEEKTMKVILVDHHILCCNDESFFEYVTDIFDHRPKEDTWKYSDKVQSDIQKVGSCATVIANKVKRREDFLIMYKDAAAMLYDTIILDTVNFSKDVNKGTYEDRVIVEYLEKILQVNDCSVHRSNILTSLTKARSDVSKLSAAQLLRKDAKRKGCILVPTVPMLVKVLLTRPDVDTALSECLKDFKLILIIGIRIEDPMERDLFVYGSEKDVNELCEVLKASQTPSLGLIEEQVDLKMGRFFQQTNLGASRKQILPILDAYFVNSDTNN